MIVQSSVKASGKIDGEFRVKRERNSPSILLYELWPPFHVYLIHDRREERAKHGSNSHKYGIVIPQIQALGLLHISTVSLDHRLLSEDLR